MDVINDIQLIQILTLVSSLTILCILWTSPELHRKVWKEARAALCNFATALQLHEYEADVASVYTHCQHSTVTCHQDMKTQPAVLQQSKKKSQLTFKMKTMNYFSSTYFLPLSMGYSLSSEADGFSAHFSYFIWRNMLMSMSLHSPTINFLRYLSKASSHFFLIYRKM